MVYTWASKAQCYHLLGTYLCATMVVGPFRHTNPAAVGAREHCVRDTDARTQLLDKSCTTLQHQDVHRKQEPARDVHRVFDRSNLRLAAQVAEGALQGDQVVAILLKSLFPDEGPHGAGMRCAALQQQAPGRRPRSRTSVHAGVYLEELSRASHEVSAVALLSRVVIRLRLFCRGSQY